MTRVVLDLPWAKILEIPGLSISQQCVLSVVLLVATIKESDDLYEFPVDLKLHIYSSKKTQ